MLARGGNDGDDRASTSTVSRPLQHILRGTRKRHQARALATVLLKTGFVIFLFYF